VEAEGLGAGRLPDHVVLGDARAGPAHEPRAGPADLFRQHDRGDGPVGAPAVADLAGEVGRVAALLPVPLVRVEAGLELAAEQRLEAGAGVGYQRGIEEPVEDQEPVLAEALDLGGGDHLARSATIRQTRAISSSVL
jgi:hypothetical protein